MSDIKDKVRRKANSRYFINLVKAKGYGKCVCVCVMSERIRYNYLSI